MTTATAPTWKILTLWILRLLMAALFLFAAYAKLSSQPMMVEQFGQLGQYGLGQWFRYFTGALEVVGAVALLMPRISALGALLLLCVDIGAFIAQVAVFHGDWIHTVVIGLVLGVLIYLQRDQLSRAPT